MKAETGVRKKQSGKKGNDVQSRSLRRDKPGM
jgi:hypothetical protein